MASTGSRKRVKPNPSSATSQSLANKNDPSAALSVEPSAHGLTVQTQGNAISSYTKSWPRVSKAPPVTEVARESISVASNVATESSSSAPGSPRSLRSRSSIQLTKKEGSSSRAPPADTATTRVNVASNGSASTTIESLPSAATPNTSRDDVKDGKQTRLELRDTTATESKAASGGGQPGDALNTQERHGNPLKPSEQPTGWFGWLSWSTRVDNSSSTNEATQSCAAEEAERTPLAQIHTISEPRTKQDDQVTNKSPPILANLTETSTAQKRSWLQMWRGSTSLSKEELPQEVKQESHLHQNGPASENVASIEPPVEEAQNDAEETNGSSKRASTIGRSSVWAFWSKDVPKDPSEGPSQGAEAGQTAVLGSNKELIVAETTPQPSLVKMAARRKIPKNNGDAATAAAAAVTSSDTGPPEPIQVKTADVSASKQLQSVLPNQLLPSFKETFAVQESPSLFQSFARLLHYSKDPGNKHVSIVRDPVRPKKALAIGVHGYFPAPVIRSVLGQPTGTSIKFANMAAKAIHQWAENHNYRCDVEKIALEGEGRIAERLDLLWKLLLNWMEDIRKADLIMIACHSQGVPVAVMLVAKLISFGCLNAARIGICAMAGVNLGPSPDYKSRWISGSAGELFDFARSDSKVSQDYETALECALTFGVRIAYVCSIDDQLVSLEVTLFPQTFIYFSELISSDSHSTKSPLYSPQRRIHTSIVRSLLTAEFTLRACKLPRFLPSRRKPADHHFSSLSHLVGFTLRMRNLGISDHGIIRELSAPLVGSLYTSEGHSRLHNEEDIYYLAVEFALETSNISGAKLSIQRPCPSSTPNPYILPFAMRGLLEEDFVRRELHKETIELLKQFDDWKPSTNKLKDVKFRLEGIRSKL
ncbi:hypothetical protein Egran_03935 [Elaphomyces granulatus]|uniref:YMC020W-like alpha/beta hydrolase domain-containing protein n=1 Tax=Elaphomyces granulatus TaxID=519963 RepID=A0A232LW53_9EURO|nr:hypothetical protein Egran_03935 [Elaphomyces granulatus]